MRNRVVNQHVLRAISIGLAAFIATSTPLTVLASEGDSDGGEGSGSEQSESKSQSDHKDSAKSSSDSAKSSSESAKSSSESAKSSSESASSSAESAKSSSESAKSSAGSAESSSETAETKAGEAKSEVSDNVDTDKMESDANSATSKATEAEGLVEKAENEFNDAKSDAEDALNAAAKATDDSTEESNATTDSLQGKIDEFNKEVQDKLDAVGDAKKSDGVTDEQFKSVADKSQQAKEDVLTALETALQTDGQERVDAAIAADEAAKKAEEAADEAEANRQAAEDDYNKKLAAYNEAAKLLGLPLYGAEDAEASEKLTEIDKAYGQINADLEAAQKAAIADLEQAKKDYEAAEATAKDAADTAELAASAAEEAQKLIDGVQDGVLADSKDAVDATDDAVKKAETAIGEADKAITDAKNDKQDAKDAAADAAKYAEDAKEFAGSADKEATKTLNYYVDQAKNDLKDAKDEVSVQEGVCAGKDAAVATAISERDSYVERYIANYAGEKPTRDQYRWQWQYEAAVLDWKIDVEKASWKVQRTDEYKKRTETINNCESARDAAYNDLAAKKATVATKEHELQEKNDAVAAIQKDYLDKLENGQKEAADAALAALKDQYTLADRDNYLAAEKVIMGMTNALFHEYSNNPEWMDTLYDKIRYEEEIAAAKGIANKYSSQDAAFRAAQKKMAAYLEEEFEGKVVGYGDWEGFLDPMTVGERTAVIKAMANACSQYYVEAYNDYQAKVSALEAKDYAKVAEDAAKEAAGYVKGLDGLEDSLKASKDNVDAAQGILDTIKDTDGKLKAEKVYDDAAKYISDVEKQVDDVAATAKEIQGKANGLVSAGQDGMDAVDTAIGIYKDQIEDQKEATQKVYDALREEGSAYDNLRKELETLLAQLNAAKATLTKAEKAVTEANKVAEAVKTLAQYTNNYASYEAEYASYKEQGGKGSIPLATGFAQISRDEEGNIIYNTANDKEYDQSNSGVISRPVSDFADISGWKGLEVPETIYQAYLTQIAARHRDKNTGIADDRGKGISTDDTMPVIYWELGEDGKATGRFFESTSELTDGGKYFVAYTFKKEGDMSTKGYHLDGFLFTYEAPAREEGGNDDGNDGGGSTGGGTTGGRRTTTTATTTVTINDAGVPLAAGLDGVVIDDGAVPLAAGLDTVMINDEDVPLADSIPQTGDNAVPVAPVAATGITALLAAFFMGKRKKED